MPGRRPRDIVGDFRSLTRVPLPLNSPRAITNGSSALDETNFGIGPNLEKVELSCVGVWLVFGNYGCIEHVRVEVLKGCSVNSASLPFWTQSGLW